MGKLDSGHDSPKSFIVTGVLADFPNTSTLQYDALSASKTPATSIAKTSGDHTNHEVL
jgi:hypothetical protein